jgi:ornithine carbamoyltransferase
MKDLKGRDLKGIADFAGEEIEFTLEVSRLLKIEQKMGRPHRLLEGKTLAGIFETPSTRTSISFETAMTQLGGHMIYLDEHRMWVGTAAEEDWPDTVKTIDRFADGIAYRAIRRETLESAAGYAGIPLINASCPVEHPCQAFADVMTMREKKGSIKKAKVALVWGYRTANPPAGLTNSLMLMAGKLGFDLTVACPEGFDPDMGIKAAADRDAALSGGSVRIVRS